MDPLLTDGQVAILNAARTILDRLETEAATAGWAATREHDDTPYGHDYGRLAQAASAASTALFMVLNVTNAHRIRRLSDAQLHNHPADETRDDDPHSRTVARLVV